MSEPQLHVTSPSKPAVRAERDARRYLPDVLADLFDRDNPTLTGTPERDSGADLIAQVGNRTLLFQVKTTSSPGIIAHFADHARDRDPRTVLVVPHMSRSGAETAARLKVNWVDLSGNASIRDRHTYVHVEGKPNRFPTRGRPASAFAPRSSRVSRMMLLQPRRWWTQKELAFSTGLDAGRVSRIIGVLRADQLLEQTDHGLRSRDPFALLDAWAEDYKFARHDIVTGHLSGNGLDLAHNIHHTLRTSEHRHAFTGLAAAWLLEPFARFRLVTVYVDQDPRVSAEQLGMRIGDRGANVQIVGPDDNGVFAGGTENQGLPRVSAVQTYLDLLALPERAQEAATRLRDSGKLFSDDS